MAGLQRIAEDLSLPYTKVGVDGSKRRESLSSNEEQNDLDNESLTTVIVPALGVDMAEPYSDGQIKLLALNVHAQFSTFSLFSMLMTLSHLVIL